MGRAVTALMALIVGMALGGCSADEQAPEARESSAESSAVEPSEAPADDPLPCVPGAEPFTGPAADQFGAERVMAAYCMLAEQVERQERTSLTRLVPAQQVKDVVALRRLLTPHAAAGWAGLARARAAGDPRATVRINGLTLHDVREAPPGYVGADDGPYVFGTQVGAATAAVVPDGSALELTFTMRTGVVLEERGDASGRHSLLPVTRGATYVLVPDGDGWLIDDWEATFEHGAPQLVSG